MALALATSAPHSVVRRLFLITRCIIIAGIAKSLSYCGNPGKSESVTGDTRGPTEHIFGVISSQAVGQSAMAGYLMALFDRDTEIARVSEVNQSGIFKFRNVPVLGNYTLALISPEYVIASVLSMPHTDPLYAKQYFQIKGLALPPLIHFGPVLNWQKTSGITIDRTLSSDSDSDGVPDGAIKFLELNELYLQEAAQENKDSKGNIPDDLDGDGVKNVKDPDIDADGVINVLDVDDDNDGILDVFDADSDNDFILDRLQATNQYYFPEGVEWIAVKFEMRPLDSGDYQSTITFTTQLRPNEEAPTAVQIKGAASLLNGAKIEVRNQEGAVLEQAWQKDLKDDGLSEDSSPGDWIFGRKIILDRNISPIAHQVVFFQLHYGQGEGAYSKEYAYTFPPVVPSAISQVFDPETRTIALQGNPFGEIQEFEWIVTIFDEAGKTLIFTSQALSGTERSQTLPSNILESGKTYKYKLIAQSPQGIPGFSAYAVHSPLQTLTIP